MKKFKIEDLFVPVSAIYLLFTLLWNGLVEKSSLSLTIYDTYYVIDSRSMGWLFFFTSLIVFVLYKLIRKKSPAIYFWVSHIHFYGSMGTMAVLLYFSIAGYFSVSPRRYIQIKDDSSNYLQLASVLTGLVFLLSQICFLSYFLWEIMRCKKNSPLGETS
jgi:heme/copper-type cytochrome/quinol oxidase subunit 1